MKSIIMSIQPQYCEKILSGEKTVELRKTSPKEVPFKVYMYCTLKNKTLFKSYWYCKNGKWSEESGKVVGEFIVNKIDEYSIPYPAFWNEFKDFDLLCKQSCLSKLEIHNYAGNNTIYALHISDLKIYDTPKPLSDFVNTKGKTITRAPQSWQYVELKGE